MLKRLSIDQFVIISNLNLEFNPGLTVLTGETGAGKSILLDAMGLILGDPPSPKAIRAGAEESRIEAAFAPPAGHPVWKFLTNHDLASGPEITVHRLFSRAGKDEILVNGKPAARELLHEMGTYLVEIHGQFANQNLLEPSRQLGLLDDFGAYPPEVLGNVAKTYRDILRYTKELEEERIFIARNAHEQPQIERRLKELEKFGMRKGLYEETKAELARLINIRDTHEVFQSVRSQLVASTGAEQALSKSNRIVAKQKDVNPEDLVALSGHLSVALDNVRAAIDDMMELMPKYSVDTKEIHNLEEILEGLKRASDECKVLPEKLFDFFEEMTGKLARIKNSRALITKIDDALDKSKIAYRQFAHILTEARVKAGKALSAAITAEMPPLKLLRAEFEIQVVEKVDNPWGELGFNEVVFTARMNPGQPFSPIAETASGGELARMILALKVVLQRVQTIPTLVFDEVDTGIGGAAAAAVGERLARLADATQVLVITHSPQVASRGDGHLHVSKKSDGVTTETVVVGLSSEKRIAEISRMLAGDKITGESHAAAQSLIEEAAAAAAARREGQAKGLG